MKFFLFLLLAFGLNLRVQAQQPAIVPVQPTGTRAHTQLDTLHAVQRLFHIQRKGSKALLISSLVSGLVFSVFYPALMHYGRAKDDYSAGTITGATLIGVLPSILAAGKLARFSEKKKKAVVEAYESGKPLPPDIRGLLRPKHFAVGDSQ